MGYNVRREGNKIPTFEGGPGFAAGDAKHELYLLAADSLMLSDSKFYESGDERVERFSQLVNQVEPEFLGKLAVYLREKMYLRSLPSALVAEALQRKATNAQDAARRVWIRGDEHLEALAYLDATNQKRTKNFLRAVATRMVSLNEKQVIKYSKSRSSYSQKDALCLSHAWSDSPFHSALLKYIRRGWDALTPDEKMELPVVSVVRSEGGALTWEQKLSQGGDKKEAWESMIPNMGYMALLRNLRNFVNAGVEDDLLRAVAETISDPERVLTSKQLPFRFLNALNALRKYWTGWNTSRGSFIGPRYLRDAVIGALNASAATVPEVGGDTIVLVDASGSMFTSISGEGSTTLVELASLLAALFASRNNSDVMTFANDNVMVDIPRATPTWAAHLLITDACRGGGTYLGGALDEVTASGRTYDRAVIITDEQAHDDAWGAAVRLADKKGTSVYVVNVGGYGKYGIAGLEKHPKIRTVAGWSDRVFDWILAVEDSSAISLIEDLYNASV